METTANSYPESNSSSPLSRDSDTPPLPDYKVKLMCSYGGTIQPRPHDNTLSYIGGDTKIISLPRSSSFSSLLSKLSSLSPSLSFKYQLPGHDLDSLISVTNDDDLHHLMSEYDRLSRSSPKPPRLRIFLFPLCNSLPPSDPNPDSNWFVHALNSVSSSSPPTPSPPNSDSSNPDFLFGLDPVASVHSQLERSKVSAVNYWPPPPPPADQQQQQSFYVFQSPAAGVYHENRNGAPPGTGQAYCSVQAAYSAPPQVVSSAVQGYAQMGYDSAGRPVYYGVAPPQYQVVSAAGDGGKAVQASAV